MLCFRGGLGGVLSGVFDRSGEVSWAGFEISQVPWRQRLTVGLPGAEGLGEGVRLRADSGSAYCNRQVAYIESLVNGTAGLRV